MITTYLAKAETLVQLGKDGQYRWYLDVFETSEAIGDKLIYKESRRKHWLPVVKACAKKNNIDWRLLDLVIKAESAYHQEAMSPKGAYGLMQLMPQTAKELQVDRKLPRQNICGGAKYLYLLYTNFKDWALSLAAYNAGAAQVEKYNGIPPFIETQNYVRKILDRYERLTTK